MNYLAHFYLAFEDTELLLGQFLGDYIKGRKHELFPDRVRQGILLHRFIDSTTDTSVLTEGIRHVLRPELSRYSGIALDVYFDHFLAVNWNTFGNCSLEDFASWVYDSLLAQSVNMNEEMKTVLKYMKKYNWLGRYSTKEGIERTLLEMSGRMPIGNQLQKAPEVFVNQYTQIENAFLDFFPQLIAESKAKLDTFAARD